MTTIGQYAFYNCSSLASIAIPQSISIIENGLFYGCSSLAGVDIPSTVTSIGDEAFYGCSSLASVDIPNTVTSIGAVAFWQCSSLKSINIPNSVTTIEEYAFEGCSSLANVTIPHSVTTIGDYAFSNCYSLTNVTIGKSVTGIEKNTFKYCLLDNIYCYANPKGFVWNDDIYCDGFKPDKGTLFHVYKRRDWEKAFPDANVTFVDDLKPKITVGIIYRNNKPEFWSSFYDSSENFVADEGIRVFMVNADNNQLKLIEVKDRIINKGQGVVLKSATEDVSLSYSETASSADYSQNSLTGTDVDMTNPGNAYVLNSKTSGLGFYKLSAEGKIRANKAYLVGSADARDFMAFDDEDATGIKSAASNKDSNNVYNLSGQRVSRPSKGIYVVDGKKVMMK